MTNIAAIAVDGSPASIAAVKWAAQAFPDGTTILAMDVQDPRLFYHQQTEGEPTHQGYVDAEAFARQWARRASEIAQEAQAECPSLQWVTIQETFNHHQPAAAFYDAALKQNAEILVVGRHHGSSLTEGLFGSFPHWLVAHSQIPVIVIPPHMDLPQA